MIISKRGIRGVPVAVVIAALALCALLGAAGCGKEEASGPMKVAASTVPLADFCTEVGGDLVEVKTMVPPGASPHTFEPTTEQMKFMSDAKVFVQNGLNLEAWAADIVRKVDNQDLVDVVAGDNVPKSELIEVGGEKHEHGEGEKCECNGHEPDHREEIGRDHEEDVENDDHEHGIYDPHVWLDPNLAACEVEAIRDGFIKADPDNEEEYKENAQEYIEELKELDEYVKGETSSFTEKKFVSFHPAFRYFARRYGLEQVGVVEELPGKEPSAGEIAELIDGIKREGVKVMFTEPQFNPQAAEAIAAEAGAEVVLKLLDPLGNPDDPETCTYVKLIKRNTGVMAEAMK
ncbi:MAG: metal ABC transporter substrate-binding protein [Actinomycetia bacterium]|nr:metal ABC transporter substrate-binding protein [Actinomycetota bacterium]MCG2796344.1 metal ABC transporter substrate-binding protein [Actinomycetes bacterium]